MREKRSIHFRIIIGCICIMSVVIGILSVNMREKKKDITLVSVEEALNGTSKEWKNIEGKLWFDGIVQTPEVEQLYKWEVKLSDKVYQNGEKTREIFLHYYDNLERKESNGEETTPLAFKYITYRDEEEGENTDELIVGADGGFCMAMDTTYYANEVEGKKWHVIPGNEELPYETLYFFETDGTCIDKGRDSYELYGGTEMSIQKCMDSLQQIMDDYHSLEPSITFVPDYVSVFKNEKLGNYILMPHAAIAYDGVRVDGSCIYNQAICENNNVCRLFTALCGYVYYEDNLPFMVSMHSAYITGKKVEAYDEIISFEQAWERLKGEVETEEVIEIQRAELVYSIWYESSEDTDADWTMELNQPPNMYATPVWRFTSYQSANMSRVYYVDAINGEVITYTHAYLQ